MSRAAWGILLAILASNAAWIATAPSAEARPSAPEPPSRVPELKAQLARLETEIAGRAAPPQPENGRRPSALDASWAEAWSRAKTWIDALLQISDAGKHATALRSMEEALAGTDPAAVQGALRALAHTRHVRFDKARFRPLILPHLRSELPSIRLAALYALVNTKAVPEDVDLILPLAEDPEPEVRTSVPHVLSMITKGDMTGAPGEALLKLLHDPDYRLVVDAMRGVGTMNKVPPDVVDRFLELAADKEKRNDILHFALMNLPKSKKVVDAMLGYIDEGTWLSSVGVGLQRGIQDDVKDYLCKEILARLEKAADDNSQYEYLMILHFNADARHREALRGLIDAKVIRPQNERRAEEIAGRLR